MVDGLSVLRFTDEQFAAHLKRKTQRAIAVAGEANAADVPALFKAPPASTGPYPFVALCRDAGLPEPVAEWQFDRGKPPRRFRFDYAWPTHRIAVEIEGGIWTDGRHTRGAGYLRDMEKYNLAVKGGWRLLRYAPTQLLVAIADVRFLLEQDKRDMAPGPAPEAA